MDSNNWRVKRETAEIPSKEQTRTPMRSYQQRRSNLNDSSFGGNSSSPFGNGRRSFPFQDQSRDGLRKPLNDDKVDRAIEEGRRVYVGNLPYEATVQDVESLFKEIAEGIQAINMAVDPMTGRNPSYCFVDFANKGLAERVMEEYNGREFMRRPLKVKPGVKSGTGRGRFDMPPRSNESSSPTYNRWNRLEAPESVNTASEEGRRLYVGGLPRFESQEESDAQIRGLFESVGFRPEVISKLVWRNESMRWKEGNNNYCFVDLKSPKEAEAAIVALDGKELWGWNIKVSHASGTSGKLAERRRLFVSGLPAFPDQETADAGVRELFQAYEVHYMTKLFAPRQEKVNEEGNHHYCFVELENEAQTDDAIKELDWMEMWGWKVRVKLATKTGTTKPEGDQTWRGSKPFDSLRKNE